jgi:hypothetical protein
MGTYTLQVNWMKESIILLQGGPFTSSPSGLLSALLSRLFLRGYLILGSGGQMTGCRGIARGTRCTACLWYNSGFVVGTGISMQCKECRGQYSSAMMVRISHCDVNCKALSWKCCCCCMQAEAEWPSFENASLHICDVTWSRHFSLPLSFLDCLWSEANDKLQLAYCMCWVGGLDITKTSTKSNP